MGSHALSDRQNLRLTFQTLSDIRLPIDSTPHQSPQVASCIARYMMRRCRCLTPHPSYSARLRPYPDDSPGTICPSSSISPLPDLRSPTRSRSQGIYPAYARCHDSVHIGLQYHHLGIPTAYGLCGIVGGVRGVASQSLRISCMSICRAQKFASAFFASWDASGRLCSSLVVVRFGLPNQAEMAMRAMRRRFDRFWFIVYLQCR